MPEAARGAMPRLATYKAFQEAAEACADVAAMMRVDTGDVPKDDRTNFAALGERHVISASLVPMLQEATGLRNRLVHEYEKLDDAIALASVARLAGALTAFIVEVEAWLASRRK